MKKDFDVIIIGSGFGGSVMSCRLSEKGKSVCLLERGKQYGMHDFPRRVQDIKSKFFWDPKDNQYGVMEFNNYPGSDVMSVTASGLGGGSLIYANVLIRVPEPFFKGWPGDIDAKKLEPYYIKALDMLEASPYPQDDPYYNATPKMQAMRSIASGLSASKDATAKPEFIAPDLAIRFKGDFPGEQSLNKHGALQSKCNKCGECDIGCNIHAKNTLDHNYLFRAQKLGAQIRTHALVTKITPIESGGYQVEYSDPQNMEEKITLTAEKVILSAGSIGSTALLLKMKKYGHLTNISKQLGEGWCANGDLGGAVLNSNKELDPTDGPVITSAIKYRFENYPDGFAHGAYIQEAGLPIGLAWYFNGKIPSPKSIIDLIKFMCSILKGWILRAFKIKFSQNTEVNIGNTIGNMIDSGKLFQKTLFLLGMGRDRSDGMIKLREEDDTPIIKWDIKSSELHYNRVRREMGKIAKQLDGEFVDNPLTYVDKIIAVHPLGGCVMGNNIEEGVVSTKAEVFGHPGLYVIDGSIIPTSLGPNPSLTISALAEMMAQQFE